MLLLQRNILTGVFEIASIPTFYWAGHQQKLAGLIHFNTFIQCSAPSASRKYPKSVKCTANLTILLFAIVMIPFSDEPPTNQNCCEMNTEDDCTSAVRNSQKMIWVTLKTFWRGTQKQGAGTAYHVQGFPDCDVIWQRILFWSKNLLRTQPFWRLSRLHEFWPRMSTWCGVLYCRQTSRKIYLGIKRVRWFQTQLIFLFEIKFCTNHSHDQENPCALPSHYHHRVKHRHLASVYPLNCFEDDSQHFLASVKAEM